VNIDDLLRDLGETLAGVPNASTDEKLREDFTLMCRRIDESPAEQQRIDDIADVLGAEEYLYDQALAAVGRGDRDTAAALLHRCAETGAGESAWLLAQLLEDAGSTREAMTWYRRARDEGDPRADEKLAEHLSNVLNQAAPPRRLPGYDREAVMKDFLEQKGISQPTVPEGRPADGLAAEAGLGGHGDAAAGTSADSPGGRAGAEVSVPGHAKPARVENEPGRKKTWKERRRDLYKAAAAVGVGVGVAMAVDHYQNRRLTDQDEIADAVRAQVLASTRALHPDSSAEWRDLLDSSRHAPAQPGRLHKALQELGVMDKPEGGGFLIVLTLSADPGALALGPQLAVYAASIGIKTALVIGPGPGARAAALRAACATAPTDRPGNLRAAGHNAIEDAEREHAADELTILVTVVDFDAKPVLETIRAPVSIVIGVSAGAATKEQLATLAEVGDGRAVVGILIAKPDDGRPRNRPYPGPSQGIRAQARERKSDITAAGRPVCDLLV
jgi:hypothetical protein